MPSTVFDTSEQMQDPLSWGSKYINKYYLFVN